MGHFIKDLVMNVSKERINEVFIMVGTDLFRKKKKTKKHINPYKMKVMGIKHDLGKGHVLFDSSEGKHNFYFYHNLVPHILSM